MAHNEDVTQAVDPESMEVEPSTDADAGTMLTSSPIDSAAAAAAREAWQAFAPADRFGRLEDIGAWLAAVHGRCPPRALQRPVALIVAGDHGIAGTAGTSTAPTDATALAVREIARGGGLVNTTARTVDAAVRLVDAGVDADPDYLDDVDPRIAAHRIRRSSDPIDIDDAMSIDDAARAVALGRALVDEEVDSGADLIITGHVGAGATTPASAIIGLLTAGDPVTVTGRGSGIDDAAWMRKVAAVRDAMYRSRDAKGDIIRLLARTGGADIAVLTGMLLQAAVRRTPVILDDVVVAAAALLAHRADFRSRQWWMAGSASTEPAQARALDRLDLQPVLDLRIDHGEAVGALLCLPIMRTAIDLTERATVST